MLTRHHGFHQTDQCHSRWNAADKLRGTHDLDGKASGAGVQDHGVASQLGAFGVEGDDGQGLAAGRTSKVEVRRPGLASDNRQSLKERIEKETERLRREQGIDDEPDSP